jgi:hypothetical protein
MSLQAESAGRFAHEALSSGPGEVMAVFRRSFYVRCAEERYACVGDASLGHGPLNVLVRAFRAFGLGERVAISLQDASLWMPPPLAAPSTQGLAGLQLAARGRAPDEGLGCLVAGTHNSLVTHAQPALEALDGWLVGNALAPEAEKLIGLGPGLTPSGDDYLGGMLVALRAYGRAAQADSLWRWLKPRLERTSTISGAHLAAAAAGEAHEALHHALATLFSGAEDWRDTLDRLDEVGHCSGWDGLAGVAAVARRA